MLNYMKLPMIQFNRKTLLLATTLMAVSLNAQALPYGPTPTENQIRRQDMEKYAIVSSPDGKISVRVQEEGGAYEVMYQNKKVLSIPAVGVTTSAKDGLTPQLIQKKLKGKKVNADYQMLSGKRTNCANKGNE